MTREELRRQYGEEFCIMEGVASADYCEWLENYVIEKQQVIPHLHERIKYLEIQLAEARRDEQERIMKLHRYQERQNDSFRKQREYIAELQEIHKTIEDLHLRKKEVD